MTKMDLNIAVIILAGGKSTRFKGNKLLATINDISVLNRTIKPYLGVNQITDIIIVTGAFHNEIVEHLKGSRTKIVENQDFEKGMASSIITGIKKLDVDNITGVFIHPGDIPFILEDDIIGMITNLDDNSIIIPKFQTKRGHPVLLNKNLIPELKSINSYKMGLRSYIHKFQEKVKIYETNNPGVLIDIDYRKDVQQIPQHIINHH